MPDHTHCPDCGEGIFKLATEAGRHIRVDAECSPFGDIAMIGNLAITLSGQRLDTARQQGMALRQHHGRTCPGPPPKPAPDAKKFKRGPKKKVTHARV